MALINDRWRIPVREPRRLEAGQLALADIGPATVAQRIDQVAYRPFWKMIEEHLDAALAFSPSASGELPPEEERATWFKALALAYYASRENHLAQRATQLLMQVNTGQWGAWCGAPDGIIDYLMGVDLLAAAGALHPGHVKVFREQLGTKVQEGHLIAPRLPQNNWRIETDCGTALAALFWWHEPGPWDVQQWLEAALDGLGRMLYGLLSRDGAFEEGPNYSRRAAIPFVRLAYVYLRLTGIDLINHPNLALWHRWQVLVKQPCGRMFPFDDSNFRNERYPHPLLVNATFAGAASQRYAFELDPDSGVSPEWAAEAMLLYDSSIEARPPSGPSSEVLADSGTAIFRSGWDSDAVVGLLLCRPLRPFGADVVNTAHRHDDPLQFLLHAHGRLLALDCGYGPGYLSPERFAWNLSPLAHNLILVDGEGPPRITSYGGDWAHPNVCQSDGRVIQLCRKNNLFAAQAQTSYRSVDFCRSVFFVVQRYFIIIDEIQSQREHTYSWLLHGGSTELELEGPRATWTVGPARLWTQLWATAPVTLEAAIGWHGHEQFEHRYLKASATGRNMRWISVLVPDEAQMPPPQVQVLEGDPVKLLVQLSGQKRSEIFNWDPNHPRQMPQLQSCKPRPRPHG